MRFTILGCGSSGGVPRLGGDWGDCDPVNPKNRRRRCSLLVERISRRGHDAASSSTPRPTCATQLLDAGVQGMDGVVYTHAHADHMPRHRRPAATDLTASAAASRSGPTARRRRRCSAASAMPSSTPPGSPYPPILRPATPIDGAFPVAGAGRSDHLHPLPAPTTARPTRSASASAALAYLPDAVEIPEESLAPPARGLRLAGSSTRCEGNRTRPTPICP
ncbi:MAG: hypothetical protein V9E89_19200 [Ilumatobacteraceae bacterium]